MLDVPEALVRAATSFGGGVGLSKNLCGCVSAAAMAVGLKFGDLTPVAKAAGPAYARTKAVVERFRERYGTVLCGELTGQFRDFASPERAYRCGEIVGFVSEQVKEILAGGEEQPGWREAWWEDYLSRRDKIK